MKKQQGFTLIELVMVIVILGILAAVALPEFADLSTEAENAAADGVYGASESAAVINYSAGLVGATQPAGAVISDGATLAAALEGGVPSGWLASGSAICIDEDASTDCTGDTYVITVTAAETATSKAVLGKSW